MLWPMFAIALGFLGIAVLGVLAVRVFVEVRGWPARSAPPRSGSAGRPRTWSGRRAAGSRTHGPDGLR